MGVAASQMERKGIVTERGNINRTILAINQKSRQLWEKIVCFKDLLKEMFAPTTPPTFASVLQSILQNGEQRIHNIKMAERIYNFMQKNNISTLPELREKVSEIQYQCDNARYNVKYLEQRIKTLNEHIKQSEIYLEHRDLYNEYKALKPRKQTKFFEAHHAGLMLFEAAERHLKKYKVGCISIKEWKEQRENLYAEKSKAYREYKTLKLQSSDAYNIYRNAWQIAREINPPPQKSVGKKHGSGRHPQLQARRLKPS